jgi:hypothetical protein
MCRKAKGGPPTAAAFACCALYRFALRLSKESARTALKIG